MKRPRPYIPLAVKIAVAERQLLEAGEVYAQHDESGRQRLEWLLALLFGDKPAQLDHDPALILRHFNPGTGEYTPSANNPDFLVWREKRAHLEKTIGRKADADKTVTTKGSDIWLKSKFRRLEGPPKRKAKIASRGFYKQKRKFRS